MTGGRGIWEQNGVFSEYKRNEMMAGKVPQAILRVMHNSLSESNSEGTYSIILEPFALALA